MPVLADSAHIMKQLFPNRCVVIYCFMWCCHPLQLLSGEVGMVGRSTCPRNLAGFLQAGHQRREGSRKQGNGIIKQAGLIPEAHM